LGLLVALVVGSAGAGDTATAFLDAVLADVNGMTITASDATIARALGLFGMLQSEKPIQAADVKQLVDAWLVEAEAARLQIEPSPAEVEEAWKAAAARVGGIDALREWLDQAGLDKEWVRKLVEGDLRWRRFIEVRFRAFVFVSDEDVTNAIGPGPHAPEVREKAVGALREEITARELTAWLAEARGRATVRITGAEGTGLPLPFALPKRGEGSTTALP
jgi:hypothetical protein